MVGPPLLVTDEAANKPLISGFFSRNLLLILAVAENKVKVEPKIRVFIDECEKDMKSECTE